jgi:hypothetical protein
MGFTEPCTSTTFATYALPCYLFGTRIPKRESRREREEKRKEVVLKTFESLGEIAGRRVETLCFSALGALPAVIGLEGSLKILEGFSSRRSGRGAREGAVRGKQALETASRL